MFLSLRSLLAKNHSISFLQEPKRRWWKNWIFLLMKYQRWRKLVLQLLAYICQKTNSAQSQKWGEYGCDPFVCSDSASLAFTEAKEATATLLSLPEIADEITLLGLKGLIRVVQDPVLNLASRMFVESSAPVKEEFQNVKGKYFFPSVESLHFKNLPRNLGSI